MNIIRLRALLAAILVIIISACSTPSEIAEPTLEPQFGTRGYDSVEDVAYGKAGILYTVGTWDSDVDMRQGVFPPKGNSEAYLRRYDRSGNLVWENYFDLEPAHASKAHQMTAHAVVVDRNGNALVAWSAVYREHLPPEAEEVFAFNYLSKYDRNGKRLWRVNATPQFNPSYGTRSPLITDLATDSSGNVYLTSIADSIYESSGTALTKYSASGARLWEKTMGYPQGPTGVAVSSTNNVYIVRKGGSVVKYSSNGSMIWVKTDSLGDFFGRDYKIVAGLSDELYVLGSYQYKYEQAEECDYPADTYYFYARLYKLDKNGAQQWYKNAAMMEWSNNDCAGDSRWLPQHGLNLASDSLGNVYAVGGADNNNAFATKYNRSGARLWSKFFGTFALDGATSVATFDGTEVFVGGVTYGNLAHRNLGGSDAFLREMNKDGNRIWTR
jgi:hypothetical protein